jgi:hypothetical protein
LRPECSLIFVDHTQHELAGGAPGGAYDEDDDVDAGQNELDAINEEIDAATAGLSNTAPELFEMGEGLRTLGRRAGQRARINADAGYSHFDRESELSVRSFLFVCFVFCFLFFCLFFLFVFGFFLLVFRVVTN